MTAAETAGALDRAITRALTAEGSTRAAGLLRIGLALLLWSRWANELQPFTAVDAGQVSVGWLALGAAFYVSTAWMLSGYRARLGTASAAVVTAAMVFGVGRSGTVFAWTHHHTTLLALATALLALTPCGGSFSVDRWRAVRAAIRDGRPPPPERGPVWAVPLLGVLLSTVYFWGAWDKTNAAFLSGARLEQIWIFQYASSDFAPSPAVHALFVAASVGVTLLEYVLAFGLWSRRLRPALVPVGLLLHASFYLLLPLVNTFSTTMALLYLAFYDPQEVHDAVDVCVGAAGRAGAGPPTDPADTSV